MEEKTFAIGDYVFYMENNTVRGAFVRGVFKAVWPGEKQDREPVMYLLFGDVSTPQTASFLQASRCFKSKSQLLKSL